ncbi:CapA family protein [Lapidilactobacillus bayanensis]|uniref:CapA family protein n=1 Tax=Lapidilactobacillus bayanensis TaxID=2485998 RepID=UPI000F78586E|nr:CapA family protein [Lapidilactobacillus bayanensis]
MIKKRARLIGGLVLIGLVLAGCSTKGSSKKATSSQTVKSSSKVSKSSKTTSTSKSTKAETIHLTFMGDNTLGTDVKFNSATSLPTVWAQHNNDPHYFFKNVEQYFQNDDLTIANLETTLTTSDQQADKGTGRVFHFKGNPQIAKALTASSIEAVTVSNNHIMDYGQQGFDDTIKTLKENKIGYFGEGYLYAHTVKGVKFGFLGYQGWTATSADKKKIRDNIKKLREHGCQIVIPYFHWGIERDAYPNDTQKTLAHYAIDHGADMVIGSHPHVIQSMELYKGKLIAYSMSNFTFGGNSNPSDMRSFILQTDLTVQDQKVTAAKFRVIPTRISSTAAYNDYQPTPYTGSEATTVLKYMNSLSPTFNNRISNSFVGIDK